MNRLSFIALLLVVFSFRTNGQDKKFTDEQLIKLYRGLRVADISDGMDMVGLMDVGLMEPAITSLWKDISNFKHQFVGIALTVRYVSTNRP